MQRATITGICLIATGVTIALQNFMTPALALEGCYCAKRNEAIRHCGRIVRLGDDAVTLEPPDGEQITLDRGRFAECRGPPCPPGQILQDGKCVDRTAGPCPSGRRMQNGTCVPLVEPPEPPDEHFGIAGSNTVGERLMPALIEAFARKQGWVAYGKTCGDTPFRLRKGGWTLSIACSAHGTNTGIPALAEGSVDIAMLSRPINTAEQESMRKAGYSKMKERHETVVALDGLLIIVSPQNRAPALSVGQIAKVFAGEITDWSQIGGAAGKINLYVRDEKSGTRDSFQAMVMEPLAKGISSAALKFESSSELSDRVAADPRGIGFVGFAYQRQARALPIAQECGISHQPSTFAIKTEDYPLSRRLFLYTAKARSTYSRDLVDFTLTEPAQSVIESVGYVNQTIAAWSVSQTKGRVAAYVAAPPKEPDLQTDPKLMAELRAAAERAERLSISFRFRPNSATLDTKAWQDVVRLADHMKESAHNRKVLLLGFADAQGPFAHNLRLSQERADEVRAALLGSGAGLSPNLIVAKGYGELMPVACNADEVSREKNRRVEAWLVASWRQAAPSSTRVRVLRGPSDATEEPLRLPIHPMSPYQWR